MLRYFIKRLLGMIPTLIIVAVCVFFFIHLLPGDPARLAAGPEADEATVEMIRHSLGLDRSIPEQFVNFVVGACQGDFVLEALHSPVDHARRSGCRRDGPLHACLLRGSAP